MDTQTEVIEKRSDLWWNMFSRIFKGQLRKSFHGMYLLNPPDFKAIEGKQIICFINHPSWNDPMLMTFMHNKYFPNYHAYAPIDQEAIEGYPFMKKIGLFGVGHGNAAAMRRFLRTASAVLEQSQPTVLWITPQGRFTDQRERPVTFQPGLGAILSRCFDPDKVVTFAGAFEYTFGEEKQPEIMLNFGPAITPPEETDAASWTQACEQAMSDAQDQLAEVVISRFHQQTKLKLIMGGATGVGGFYGLWKRTLATLKGQSYDPSHASLTSNSKSTNSTES